MFKVFIAGLASLMISQVVHSQVSVSSGGQDVRVGVDGSVSVKGSGQDIRAGSGSQISVGPGNKVKSSVGEIEPGAIVEGVSIINGKLWIDGKEVSPGVERYKSPQSGKVYNIDRRGKNVSVTSND
jgi:hypothetical protein